MNSYSSHYLTNYLVPNGLNKSLNIPWLFRILFVLPLDEIICFIPTELKIDQEQREYAYFQEFSNPQDKVNGFKSNFPEGFVGLSTNHPFQLSDGSRCKSFFIAWVNMAETIYLDPSQFNQGFLIVLAGVIWFNKIWLNRMSEKFSKTSHFYYFVVLRLIYISSHFKSWIEKHERSLAGVRMFSKFKVNSI